MAFIKTPSFWKKATKSVKRGLGQARDWTQRPQVKENFGNIAKIAGAAGALALGAPYLLAAGEWLGPSGAIGLGGTGLNYLTSQAGLRQQEAQFEQMQAQQEEQSLANQVASQQMSLSGELGAGMASRGAAPSAFGGAGGYGVSRGEVPYTGGPSQYTRAGKFLDIFQDVFKSPI